jgi:hypothetical protein
MRLTDDHLVVRSGDVLYDYDLSGVLGHTWQLAAGARLLDADHGLVAYGAAGEVHVLRLSDGADDVVAVGALAHFMDGGLAVADGAHVDVVPNARLPR